MSAIVPGGFGPPYLDVALALRLAELAGADVAAAAVARLLPALAEGVAAGTGKRDDAATDDAG